MKLYSWTLTLFRSPSNDYLRHLFGYKEVESKLKATDLHLDAWFTGVDCASTAMAQIKCAVRRRTLV